ncbi:delta-type opioid receptor-like [Hydractinia symbiolongicarpus]|uniref:delta-type opioid receptor-like n=1 Tax=Hydractinia symbiolongicarpus TaxID=13093 RepID=UPI00254CCA7F|nr:delta-type opioid receptor-like [Hydractinia symbiolongicarpus]
MHNDTAVRVSTMPPPSSAPHIAEWFKVLIFIALTFTFFVGTVGNILVVHIIRKRKQKRSIHLLTLNLAASDLIVLLIYLPMQMYTIHTELEWHFGKSLCRVSYSVNSCSVNASIGTLVAITRDRYVAVMDPIVAHKRATTFIKYWIIIIWSFSVIITVPLTAVVDAKVHHTMMICTEYWPNPNYENIYWISVFVLQFVLPLIFIAASYAIILVQLQKAQTPNELVCLNNNNEDRNFASSRRITKRKKQQSRRLKMSVVLVVAYAICVLPQHSVFFATTYGNLGTKSYGILIFITSNFLMLLNSALNPVIYGTLNDEMKRGFLKMLCCEKYSLLESFRSSFQRLRLRKRTTTTESNTTNTSLSPRKTSVQFDITPVTRIDNL